MNFNNYLRRIQYKETCNPDVNTLKSLHRQHVMTIPFEDLDIHQGIPIQLNLNALYNKVVLNKRGGFCYELNYLFFELLSNVGFDCHLISSRIYKDSGKLGPEYDHMSIVVNLTESWLLDVGYGHLFVEPIIIRDGNFLESHSNSYKVDQTSDYTFLLSESRNGAPYKKIYLFDIQPKEIEDFKEICRDKQYAQDSYFVKNKICTLPTKSGRKTLLNNIFTISSDDHKKEVNISSYDDFLFIIEKEFGIVL